MPNINKPWKRISLSFVISLLIVFISYACIHVEGTCGSKDDNPCTPPYKTNFTMPCGVASCSSKQCPRFYDQSLELYCTSATNNIAVYFMIVGMSAIGAIIIWVLYILSRQYVLLIVLGHGSGLLFCLVGLILSVYFINLLINNPTSIRCSLSGAICTEEDIQKHASPCFLANCIANQCLTVSGTAWNCYESHTPYWMICVIIIIVLVCLFLCTFFLTEIQGKLSRLNGYIPIQ